MAEQWAVMPPKDRSIAKRRAQRWCRGKEATPGADNEKSKTKASAVTQVTSEERSRAWQNRTFNFRYVFQVNYIEN